MFVPIQDDNPLRKIRTPWGTWAFIAINCIVFGLQSLDLSERYAASFAIIPLELFKVGVWGGPAMGPHDAIAIPERLTLLSYMFFHGDILHLTGNMLFLWVFGDNVEDALGHARFVAFYVLCGVAGGLAHAAMLPASPLPLIGASGAVAGVITAYLLFYPRVRVWVLAFRFIPLRISAAFALGAWILMQLSMVVLPYVVPGAHVGPVAWWAHIGGIIAGAVFGLLLRRPAVTAA